jgi:hypothetical protein
MNRQALIVLIGVTLIGFILFKGAAGYLCEPKKENSVAAVISRVLPESGLNKDASKVDPLSWAPVLQHLMTVLSRACPQ